MNFSWLLIFALCLCVAESMIYRRLALRRLLYQRYLSKSVIRAGESVELVEVIENRKILPIPRVLIEDTFDSSMYLGSNIDAHMSRSEKFLTFRSIFAVRPYTRVTRRHQIRCERRGIYEFESAAMTVGGPFFGSAFKQWTFSGAGTNLTVYPRLVPDLSLFLSTHSLYGDTVVRRMIFPDPFIRQGSRLYQYGDALNQINWKATARTGDLHVHLQEFTADDNIKILLNFVVDKEMWQQISHPLRIEAGISLAATMADDFVAAGLAVGFLCNAVHPSEPLPQVKPATGRDHLEQLWSLMAGLVLQVRCDFRVLLDEELQNCNSKTDYVIITGFVDEQMEDTIAALKSAGHTITIVDLPSQQEAEAWLNPSPDPTVTGGSMRG